MFFIRGAKKGDINQLANIYQRAYSRSKEGENWSLNNAKSILNFYFKQETFLGIMAVLDGKQEKKVCCS